MKKILTVLYRFYQVVFSRRAHFPLYFIDPVIISGPFRGSGQSICHIYHYHPWSWQGYDIPPGWEEFVEKHPDAA